MKKIVLFLAAILFASAIFKGGVLLVDKLNLFQAETVEASGDVITGEMDRTSLDLSKGEIVSGRFVLTTFARIGVGVFDQNGILVRKLYMNSEGIQAGAYRGEWDGTNDSGQAVPSGNYHINFTAKDYYWRTIGFYQSSNITVINPLKPINQNSNSTNTNTNNEIEVPYYPVEGAGAGNIQLTSSESIAIAFKADKTGKVGGIMLNWISKGAYGAGNRGLFSAKIVKPDVNNYPSDQIVAIATSNLTPNVDIPSLTFPFNNPTLEAGKTYYLIIKNIASNPQYNWSSTNTMMTREQPIGARGSLLKFRSGSWVTWANWQNAWWNTSCAEFPAERANSSFVSVGLKWTDNAMTGLAYTSSTVDVPPRITAKTHLGEKIVWPFANKTIRKVSVSLIEYTAGAIKYHLSDSSGRDLASGNLAFDPIQPHRTCGMRVEEWAVANLSSAITLEQNKTYYLWLESTGDYGQYVPWTNGDSGWATITWGGTGSRLIYRDTYNLSSTQLSNPTTWLNSWSESSTRIDVDRLGGGRAQADLTFKFE